MGRKLRSAATASLASMMALMVVAPSAMAQDFPFCAILGAEEVSAAVGAQVAPMFGDDRHCNYAATAQDVFTSLSVTNGGTTMEQAKATFPAGMDVEVAGQPGYITLMDTVLYIDRGDGDTLSLQLLGQPESVDAKTALVGLGGLALPRLATLVIPTPTPFVQQDPELAARFPTEIAGAPLTVQTMAQGLNVDPEDQAQVEQVLASQGKTLADISVGFAFNMDPAYSITAFRIKGADANALRDPFMAMSDMEGTPTPAQVAGKDVLATMVNGMAQYVYTKDDVIWLVAAEEPVLTEVFQKLP